VKQKLKALYAKRSPRERKVLWMTLACLTILFSDRLVVGPVFRSLEGLDRKIHDEREAIQTSLLVLVQKERIRAEAKEFEHYSTGSKNAEAEMSELLRDVQTLAGDSDLSVLYVKPASQKEGEGMKKYFAALEAEGQMEAVATFFHRIESSSKLLKVERFEIQPKARESSSARAAITVSKTVLE
jgi:Tfp pilus assembly protein PilO